MYTEDKAQTENYQISPFLSQHFTNVEFSEWQMCLCFVNEVAIRLLDIFKDGSGDIRRLRLLLEAELFSSCPLKGYSEGMITELNHMISDIIHHAYTMQLI